MDGQTIACPHCGLETIMFISPPAIPPVNPAPKRKNKNVTVAAALIAAIAGIVCGNAIYNHRVNSLAAKLQTSFALTFKPEHIPKYLQKANLAAEAARDVNDEIRHSREAYNSVIEAAQRSAEVQKAQFANERKLIELRKSAEMQMATTPEQKLAVEFKYDGITDIEKKYSGPPESPNPTPEQLVAAKDLERKKHQEAQAKALKWHQELAEKGDAFGQLRMGERYLVGDGVEKDEMKAREFLSKSAAQGNKEAVVALETLKRTKP